MHKFVVRVFQISLSLAFTPNLAINMILPLFCFLEDRLTCRTGLICPKKKKKKIKARWCLLKDQKADTHFSIMLPGIHFSISRRLLWNECRKIIYIIKHGNFMLKSRCLALKYQDLLDARPLSELQP